MYNAEASAVQWPLPFLLMFPLSLLPMSLTLSPTVPYRHFLSITFDTFICLASQHPHPPPPLPLLASFSPVLAHFFKKCNLSVSEMPVLLKPPRTQSLPSLTTHTSLFMTLQDLPGSPQVTGTFTYSYQPLRAWNFRVKDLKRERGKVFLSLLACLILFWMPVALPVLCPLLAHAEHVNSQGFAIVSLIPGGFFCLSVCHLDAQFLERLSPSHQREFGLETRAPACLWWALGQHGDLGAEVGTVAAQGRVVILHVWTQEPLQMPPPPLSLELSLDLGGGKAIKSAEGSIFYCSDMIVWAAMSNPPTEGPRIIL